MRETSANMQAHICSQTMSDKLVVLARRAGAAILAIYQADVAPEVQHKADASPVTAADLIAHDILIAGLPELLDIPIVSEEGELPDFNERSTWPYYWLIDPLDGTQEFIQRNGEFTVNIALIAQYRPVLGVVHVPVSDTTYLGINTLQQKSKKAVKYFGGVPSKVIYTRALVSSNEQEQALVVLGSHRHGNQAFTELMLAMQTCWPSAITQVSVGSSLKFCLLAEGKADFYPRLAPTSEWDTAAGQAVLEAAGGLVLIAGTPEHGSTLRYNSKANMLNSFFYAVGDAQFAWPKLLLKELATQADYR